MKTTKTAKEPPKTIKTTSSRSSSGFSPWLGVGFSILVVVARYIFAFSQRNPRNLIVRDQDLEKNERVLILTVLKDGQSWGRGRSFSDHLNIIESLKYNASLVSLGFLVSDASEFKKMEKVLRSKEFEKKAFKEITLVKKDFPQQIGRSLSERHDLRIQRTRRNIIARARNSLLMSALKDEAYVLWIDADIIRVTPGMLHKMVKSGKDIVTPRCRFGPVDDYDGNAWQGPRKKPNSEERKQLANGGLFVPDQVHGVTKHLDDFRKSDPNRETEFVQLDSVGGTVLLVKSDVHRQGIVFPTEYIVGTEWEHFGYDGIETEGLCYLARSIGATCWGMPHVEVEHDAS